jgi:hypothetical protein
MKLQDMTLPVLLLLLLENKGICSMLAIVAVGILLVPTSETCWLLHLPPPTGSGGCPYGWLAKELVASCICIGHSLGDAVWQSGAKTSDV